MPATLAQLLARPELGLRLLAGRRSGSAGRPDPVGAQLGARRTRPRSWRPARCCSSPRPPDDVEPYVARLVAHGIAGLGFGTEVVRDGTPDALIEACERHGLPLFEVPYRTPVHRRGPVRRRPGGRRHLRPQHLGAAGLPGHLARRAATGCARGRCSRSSPRQIERPVALVGADGALGRGVPAGRSGRARTGCRRRRRRAAAAGPPPGRRYGQRRRRLLLPADARAPRGASAGCWPSAPTISTPPPIR